MFNDQPVLEDDALRMRPLVRDDLEALYLAASDPEIWVQHPVKNRHERDVFEPYFEFLMNSGGTLVAIDPQKDRIIGCSRYYETQGQPNSISIGYTFLERSYWGGETNKIMKRLMLDHAFATFPDVWLHIGTDNLRSQKATEKFGAVYVRTEPMDIVGSDGKMLCYRLSRADWLARNG